MTHRKPASEPAESESRDVELGAVLQAWVNAHAGILELRLDGPLEAAGMDPTWVLSMRTSRLEADICLFYGPVLDVSAFRPGHLGEGALIGGADGVSADRLNEILADLRDAALGNPLPDWLRPASA